MIATDPPQSDTSRGPVLLETLKQKNQEALNLQGHYIRAYTVYLAITAGLVKFALDQNSTPDLTRAMAFLGLLISAAGLVVCILGELLRRALDADLALLRTEVGLPALKSSLLSLRYTVIAGVLFIAIVVAGWIYLLLAGPA